MSDPTIDFFDFIVVPAINEYFEAEETLTVATKSNNEEALVAARRLVLRRGRTASIELHQFADRVFADKPSWGPTCGSAKMVREWLREHWCANANLLIDFDVLSSAADAFKHAVLDRKDALFRTDKVVVTTSTGWGEMRWGVGKYGGVEQLIVETTNLKTPMSAALKAVSEAWRRAMECHVAY